MGTAMRSNGKNQQIRILMTGLLLFLFAASAAIFAQLPTATILGVVKDSSGAVVPDVKITVRNVDTDQSRVTNTDQDGSYRLPALPVGNYEVHVEKAGFRTEVQTGLTLVVDQQAVLNFTLEVGSVGQSVSVTAEAPLVNTTNGSLGGLVSEEKMADLPLNGRNYIDLSLLQPGVNEQKGASSNNVAYVGTYFSSNGATVRSNNYMLDGAILVNLWGASSASATGSTLGVDGIREYKVITNSFSAEYGLTMGSQMVVVSKGGTNNFHGDAFEYLRNSAMDAANYFDRSVAANNFRRLPEFRRNNFGGSLGGPIRKDKTFFFGVFEGVKQALGITTVEPALDSACHGPANAVVWNGSGTRPAGSIGPCTQLGLNPAGTGTNSVVIAPTIAPFLALFPTPNLPSDQYTFPFTQPSTDYYGQIRVDQNISDKDSFFVRYTVQDTTQTQNTFYPQFEQGAASRNQFLTLSENHIFNPALLNTFRTSFSRTNLAWAIVNSPSVGAPQYSLVPGLPMGDLTVSGLQTLGSSGTSPRLSKQNIFTWSDDLFYTRGRHALKFGTLINHYQQVILNSQSYTGLANFTSVGTFLEGLPNFTRELTPGSILTRYYHFNTFGFYAQDDWQVRPNFTLNLGLRYEFNTVPTEAHGEYSVIKNLATDVAPVISPQVYLNPSLKNFSPRVGFAWNIGGDGKTALRGGFDYLYDLIAPQSGSNLLQSQIATPPFSNRLQANNVAFTAPLVFPSNPAALAYRPTAWNIKQPALAVYNLTLERQLPFDMALNIGFAGSRGIHFMQEQEGNPAIPQGIQNAAGTCVARPSGAAVNLTSMIDGHATACWLGGDPRVNPNFGSTDYFVAAAQSWYNALQFGLTKRVGKGLQFQSAYTWSKDTDNNSNITGEILLQTNSYPVDPFHPNVDKGPAVFDLTQVWKFNAIYQFPKLTSSGFVADKLLSGWWTSAIVTLQSGLPFTPDLNSNTSRSGVGGGTGGLDRPDLVAGRTSANIVSGTSPGCGVPGVSGYVAPGTPLGNATHYYDPCAFTIPNAGVLGTVGRDFLRGPGFADMDFSLVKDTKVSRLGEAGAVQFRAEVFNLPNHPNLGLPNRLVYAGTPGANPLSTAGQIITTIGAARQVQLALKVLF